jgi:hypothetical protein
MHGHLYQQVCSIFKYESFNTTHQAFHSIINEKKDVFVNLTTGAGNHLFITPLPEAIRCNIQTNCKRVDIIHLMSAPEGNS